MKNKKIYRKINGLLLIIFLLSVLNLNVLAATVPPVPSPLSPGTGSSPGSVISNLTPNLSWSPSIGATKYEVGLSKYNGSGYTLIWGEYVNGTSVTLPSGTIEKGNEYRWNVQAHNSAGGSGWSGRLYFYTEAEVVVVKPPVPSPLSIGTGSSPGSKTSDLAPTLSWTSSTGAENYEVGLSKLSGGSYTLIWGEYVNGTSVGLINCITTPEKNEYCFLFSFSLELVLLLIIL